ncbi:hypothetical protein [uncultured Mucilaginibacter sp.]|uniref:hypothetical protein n=1 Tax=uncultured Mucilaginibacter sp. TaxID=797541 RepID=UPI0025DC9C69|nr:hypothetical protein [uncultured Mucilaginibacter sp.]
MKKVLIILMLSLACLHSNAQLLEPGKEVYKSPKLKQAIKAHRTVAILPFDTHIAYRKTPKDFDSTAHLRNEAELSKQVQFDVYTALIKEFFKYKVRFQNIQETNQLLKQAGMEGSLDMYGKDEVAKALGVDAVIYGDFLRKENTPNVGIVAAAIFGYNKTAEVTMSLKIANGADGEVLWAYTKLMNEIGAPEAKDVFERQMEKLTRNLPYTRGVFSVF